jgi:hypothetical protein
MKLRNAISGKLAIVLLTAMFALSLPLLAAAQEGKIVFSTSRHLSANDNYEIYVMDADGSNQIRLTNNAASDTYPTFSGDGRADIAVFRPLTGSWFVQRSEDNPFFSFRFGTNGDIPAPTDYDGKFDTAVFRPSTANWFVNRSTAGILIMAFGTAGDRPIPNAFVP